MPIEIRETTIATDDAGTTVRLHIADAPLSSSDAENASFRLNLLVRLPRYKAPLVGQLQREAILEAREALAKIADAVLQEFPRDANARPQIQS